jgi:hypothetical protein
MSVFIGAKYKKYSKEKKNHRNFTSFTSEQTAPPKIKLTDFHVMINKIDPRGLSFITSRIGGQRNNNKKQSIQMGVERR